MLAYMSLQLSAEKPSRHYEDLLTNGRPILPARSCAHWKPVATISVATPPLPPAVGNTLVHVPPQQHGPLPAAQP